MVTLSNVKSFLGITGTADDTRLTAILDSVNDEVVKNVGDLSVGEKTMLVKNSAVKNSTITLNIINPTAITEINGFDFTAKVNGTDYLIKSDGEVIIKDLSLYTANDFGYFEVKFNAGYTTTPKSLIALVSNYVGYLFSQDNGKDITNEQLGPRGVSYSENNSQNDGVGDAKRRFHLGLSQFIPLSLRIF